MIKFRKIEPESMKGMSPEMATKPMDKKVYPSISIPLSVLPEGEEWENGETYEVTLKIKKTGMYMHQGKGDKEKMGDTQYDILGVAVLAEENNKKVARYGKKSS